MDKESKWLTLKEASELLTTSKGHVSKQTLWRWSMVGCRGVYLKTMRFGKRIYVTEKDLEEFSRELAERWNCTKNRIEEEKEGEKDEK